MFAPPRRSDGKRKLVEFKPEIWQALVLLARDSGISLEALAEEAFTDLLRKYRRPLSLKEALRRARGGCRRTTTRRKTNASAPEFIRRARLQRRHRIALSASLSPLHPAHP